MFVNDFVQQCYIMYIRKEVRALDKTETQVGFRTTVEFKARLEAQAAREKRTVSNLIIKVMEEYLDAVEKQEK